MTKVIATSPKEMRVTKRTSGNLLMMSSGAAGKKYIKEITRLLELWIQDSPLKSIAFYEI